MCLISRQSVSRFEKVCQGCSVVADTIPDGVGISDERAIPSCKDIPWGAVGVSSGTTIANLELEKGHFRTSDESDVVVECYRSEACVGGNDPDEYCADGYEGACKYKVPTPRRSIMTKYWI